VSSSRALRAGCVLAVAAYAAWCLSPLFGCLDRCFVDTARFYGAEGRWADLHRADLRLNAWILAWGQHALGTDPPGLFDANA